jgi:hypothetical protein
LPDAKFRVRKKRTCTLETLDLRTFCLFAERFDLPEAEGLAGFDVAEAEGAGLGLELPLSGCGVLEGGLAGARECHALEAVSGGRMFHLAIGGAARDPEESEI